MMVRMNNIPFYSLVLYVGDTRHTFGPHVSRMTTETAVSKVKVFLRNLAEATYLAQQQEDLPDGHQNVHQHLAASQASHPDSSGACSNAMLADDARL